MSKHNVTVPGSGARARRGNGAALPIRAARVKSRKSALSAIVIGEHMRIPHWIVDHQSFRRWARSEQFPERGWVSFVNGEIWVDLSMERLNHNKIKTVFTVVLATIVLEDALGHYLSDRMLLTNLAAMLSTEPDSMFVSSAGLSEGRVVLQEGDNAIEVLGTPDMTLEIVSKSSVQKATVELLDAYWRAGIQEYWLVDSRGDDVRFDIFRHGSTKYLPARKQDGWVKSALFGRTFRLTRRPGRNGISEYTLSVR